MNDSMMSKCAYHNTSASMWFVNFSSACGFAISCVDAQDVTCCLLSLFSSARLAKPPRRFGKQPQHLAGVEAAAECGASVQPVIPQDKDTMIQSSLDGLTANVTKIVVARMPQGPPFCYVSVPPPLRAGPLRR